MMFSNILKKSVFIFLIFLSCHTSDVRGSSIPELDLKHRTDFELFEPETSTQSSSTHLSTHPSNVEETTNEGLTTHIPALEDICNATHSKCMETFGHCTEDDVGNVVCKCPGFAYYKQDEGCISTPENCFVFLAHCDETGGICIPDKTGRIHCKCPPTSTYDKDIGCQGASIFCSIYKPNCQNSGGVCVSDKSGRFYCRCPKHAPLYDKDVGCRSKPEDCFMEHCDETEGVCMLNETGSIYCKCPGYTVYEKNIGCRVPIDICIKYKPSCEETGGFCMLDKIKKIQCKCANNSQYLDGIGCQDIPDPCENLPCENGGTCIPEGPHFICSCKMPFYGKFCENNLCDPNPCKNEGICRVDQGEASCFCKEPYEGEICTIRFDIKRNVLFIAIIATMSFFLLSFCVCLVYQRILLTRK